MSPEEIRLELVKVYLPICAKYEALDPCKILEKLSVLEEYVNPKPKEPEAPKEAKKTRKKKAFFDNP